MLLILIYCVPCVLMMRRLDDELFVSFWVIDISFGQHQPQGFSSSSPSASFTVTVNHSHSRTRLSTGMQHSEPVGITKVACSNHVQSHEGLYIILISRGHPMRGSQLLHYNQI